mgnify:CR=1 FL=1
MKLLTISLFGISTVLSGVAYAHNYEGGITASPIKIENKSTTVLNQPYNYPKGTPAINPLNVTLGPNESTDWHKHPVPMWVYVTKGSFAVDYGSKGKRVVKAGDSYIEAINWCHKGINGVKKSKAIVVYLGESGVDSHIGCKRQ